MEREQLRLFVRSYLTALLRDRVIHAPIDETPRQKGEAPN
jgi:hypothetical protein